MYITQPVYVEYITMMLYHNQKGLFYSLLHYNECKDTVNSMYNASNKVQP